MNKPNQAEIEAEERDRVIARFTNIDNESFTHSYKGVSITVQAGESYMGRLPECEHLAHHLARKILAREAKRKISPMDNKIRLWTPEQLRDLESKIVVRVNKEESTSNPTPEEARRQDLEQIAKNVPSKPVPEVTKKDVIAELKSRGVEANIRMTKEELLNQLMELEAQGK